MFSHTARICLPLALVLCLVGCAAEATPSPTDAEPKSSQTGETSRDGDEEALPECEGFILDEGEDVAGSIMAPCLLATTVAHNYGKMTVDTGGETGLTIFRYVPYAARVELIGDNLLFISGDEMWLKDELGWVRAENNSANPRGQMAYMVATAFRALNDPEAAIAMLEASASWKIVGEEEIERPDGNTRNGWRLDAEPFEFLGVQITEMSVWIGSDYTLLQQEAVSSALGETATTLNRYYDWGVEEEFFAPAP